METDLRIGQGDDEVRAEPKGVNQMTELFEYFVDRVLGGADIDPDGRHVLLGMETLWTICEVGRSARTVDLDWP